MWVKVKGSTPYVTIGVGVGLRAKIPATRFNVLYFKAGKKYYFKTLVLKRLIST